MCRNKDAVEKEKIPEYYVI